MKYSEVLHTVGELVEQFQENALVINREYQRGAVWTELQKGKFLDSLFRGYPVPAVFLRAKEHKGLRGTHSTFELIDGQQRLNALSDFIDDKLRLPPLTGPDRLRLPPSVANQPAFWADHTWSELSHEQRLALKNSQLRVFVIEHPTSDDEVRDLFIRLQAGTALTRQQIRDAWPGPMSPFIESIGGKGRHSAKAELLSMIDRRGERNADDDGTDPWVAHRQTCAQLLAVFINRERDALSTPGVLPDDLDDLYHESSTFDSAGEAAERFRKTLSATARVFDRLAVETGSQKAKWKKVHIFAVFLVVQDIQRSNMIPADAANLKLLAIEMMKLTNDPDLVSRFSGSAIGQWSIALREAFFKVAGRLAPVRLFSSDQKIVIFKRANGLCQICYKPVEDGEDAEYDHYPIPWIMCGPTTVENGRLVHRTCHPRGRPRKEQA